MKQIKGLIFDLDGVITETASLHYKAWAKILKDKGIEYTEEENASIKGLPRPDTLKAILKMKKIENKFSQLEFEQILEDKNTYYVQSLKSKLTKSDILPGIKKLLDDAKKNNLKMAIVSSSRNAPMILESLDLINYFDYIADPVEVKNGKPAPDIFLLGVKGLNLKPSEVIGFEDAIEGAKGLFDANVYTVVITHNVEANWSEYASQIYKNTSQLDLETIMKAALKS
ncbi:beta-phosphoglucomutase [Mycoplasma testudineum]|uniref:Beta-phosphoglucomutase n=1 Tax=Mycoplasma testudineum TaxID=244584 RepID=A0A4R6IJD5_9MOLU|nr:beta-phosphoglucomutase [Mycoplasma testudineum]OYD26440.1 beta-phosphoglucomutase [Mycoplasma testudineum]TDO22129.1 beta-phosphoglucomutase [Mycoplasma testudineum]